LYSPAQHRAPVIQATAANAGIRPERTMSTPPAEKRRRIVPSGGLPVNSKWLEIPLEKFLGKD
jgi:hypothetical protein